VYGISSLLCGRSLLVSEEKEVVLPEKSIELTNGTIIKISLPCIAMLSLDESYASDLFLRTIVKEKYERLFR